jgi:hypothetical protein
MKRMAVLTLVACLATSAQAFQVWTSTCKTPKTVLAHPDEWRVVAAQVQGLNVNFAPGSVNKPSRDQWRQIVARYTTARTNVYQTWAHPEGDYSDSQAEQFVTETLNRAKDWGYSVRFILLYDKGRENDAGKRRISTWTTNEVQRLRTWMDQHGHQDIKLIYNARNYSPRSRSLLESPAIAAALNEGCTEYWQSNKAGRQDLLRWFTTNALTRDKPFFFQITVHHDFDSNAFAATRLMVRSISADILKSTDWIRTDKAIFLPMVYPDYPEQFPFLPQFTPDGAAYGDSMCGLLCSLVEQKDLFEGRAAEGLISVAQCKSRSRIPESSIENKK